MYVCAQAFSQKNLRDLTGVTGAVSMIDDVLVFGKTQKEYDKHLTVGFGKIQKAGLTLNIKMLDLQRQANIPGPNY